MLRKIGIYKIVSPIGRIYIGQSINIYKREHDYAIYCKYQSQKRLKNSIQKYGWESHVFSIIEFCEKVNLNLRERYWQDYYNVLSYKGLNCKLTKSSDKSGKLSEITKNKIRKSLIGKVHSEQRKINERAGQKGKKRTSEHREAMKIAAIKRCNGNVDFLINSLKKIVEQYSISNELINTFDSVREAERTTKVNSASISKCCNNKGYYKTAGGYIWKYKSIQAAFQLI